MCVCVFTRWNLSPFIVDGEHRQLSGGMLCLWRAQAGPIPDCRSVWGSEHAPGMLLYSCLNTIRDVIQYHKYESTVGKNGMHYWLILDFWAKMPTYKLLCNFTPDSSPYKVKRSLDHTSQMFQRKTQLTDCSWGFICNHTRAPLFPSLTSNTCNCFSFVSFPGC